MQSSSIEAAGQPTFRLSVTGHTPSTVLTVLDGSWRECARGIGRLEADLPRGIYKVSARIGRDCWEELVTLDGSGPCHVTVPEFAFKAISPLMDTKRSHEYQSDLIGRLTDAAWEDLSPGAGARIQVVSRNWSDHGKEGKLFSAPTIERWRGDTIADLSRDGIGVDYGDKARAMSIGVSAGAYIVVVPTPHGDLRQMVFARDGWDNQVFVLADFGDGKAGPPTVETIQLMTRRGQWFDREKYELVEAARTAMADDCAVLHPDVLDEVASGKFENPILGLMAGHILLMARDGEAESQGAGALEGGGAQRLVEFHRGRFEMIVRNSARLLGDDHPDVVALRTCSEENPPAGLALAYPPLFRQSWDLLVRASNSGHPEILPATLYRRVRATATMPPYFGWMRSVAPAAARVRKVEGRMRGDIEEAILAGSASASAKAQPPRRGFTAFDAIASAPKTGAKPDARSIADWAPDFGAQIGIVPEGTRASDIARRLSKSIDLPNSAIRFIAREAIGRARKLREDDA